MLRKAKASVGYFQREDLYDAAREGDLEYVQKYIAYCREHSGVAGFAESTLHEFSEALNCATYYLQEDVARCLVNEGADPNRIQIGGLHLASFESDDARVLQLAIEVGLEPNALLWKVLRDYGVEDGDFDNYFNIANFAVMSGADVNQTWKIGAYPTCPLVLAIARGHNKIAELLLKHGAKVNVLGADGRHIRESSPVMIAAMNVNIAMLKMLLDFKANPNQVDVNGETLLMCFVRNYRRRYRSLDQFTDAVDALLAAGADINYRSMDGMTAIMLTAEIADVDVAKYLQSKGATLTKSDASWMTRQAVAPEYWLSRYKQKSKRLTTYLADVCGVIESDKTKKKKTTLARKEKPPVSKLTQSAKTNLQQYIMHEVNHLREEESLKEVVNVLDLLVTSQEKSKQQQWRDMHTVNAFLAKHESDLVNYLNDPECFMPGEILEWQKADTRAYMMQVIKSQLDQLQAEQEKQAAAMPSQVGVFAASSSSSSDAAVAALEALPSPPQDDDVAQLAGSKASREYARELAM